MKGRARAFLLVLVGGCAWVHNLGAQRPQSPASGSRTISGVVISAINGQPLEDAGVSLVDAADGKDVAETATDSEGKFWFANLPDGRFELRASDRGFVTADFDDHDYFSTAIVTGEGLDTTGLRFTLKPRGAIYGTVTEDSGDPVPNARVMLFRRRPGQGGMLIADTASADPMGNFEFPGLAAANYYLCVSGRPWYGPSRVTFDHAGEKAEQHQPSPLDVAYPVECYPDTTDSNAAELLELDAGDRVAANITLHAVPAVHVSIQLPNSNGPQGGVSMPRLLENVFGMQIPVDPSGVEAHGNEGDPMSSVELSGIAPGQYEVELLSSSGGPRVFSTIDASTAEASVDLSSAPALAEVSGKVSMAGGASVPGGVRIVLRPESGEGRTSAQVKPDGSFQVEGVRPGSYTVLIGDNVGFRYVAQMNAVGGKADGRELEVGSDAIALTIVVAEANSAVSGFAKLNGKAAPGVLVVLVPDDRGAGEGASAGPGRESAQADQTDSDGSFVWSHVLPGAYTVVAVSEGWTLEWAQPGAMARYLAGGEKVNVPGGAEKIELKDPVEVQAK